MTISAKPVSPVIIFDTAAVVTVTGSNPASNQVKSDVNLRKRRLHIFSYSDPAEAIA
jgi:hypothetical protein